MLRCIISTMAKGIDCILVLLASLNVFLSISNLIETAVITMLLVSKVGR